MSCPGLHCPGCSGCGGSKTALWIAAVLAASAAAEWILARLAVIAAVLAGAVLAAVAIVSWLMRAQRHREAAHAREHPFLAVRQVAAVEPPGRRELAQPVIIQNFFGADAASLAARAISGTLPGPAGEQITRGEES